MSKQKHIHKKQCLGTTLKKETIIIEYKCSHCDWTNRIEAEKDWESADEQN